MFSFALGFAFPAAMAVAAMVMVMTMFTALGGIIDIVIGGSSVLAFGFLGVAGHGNRSKSRA